MRRLRAEQGFTMIEALVATAIMVVIFGATLSVLEVFQKQSVTSQQRMENQDEARSALDRLARELRNVAAPSTKSAGALEAAEKNSTIFEVVDSSGAVAGGENTSNLMRVRYCLDDSNPENEVLWRQYKRWKTFESVPSSPTCPDPSASHWEGSTRLVQHIVNDLGGQKREVFRYGPPSASTVAEIASIESTLYVDTTPGVRPAESQLTSAIALRNGNRPPKATFTAVELGAGHKVSLNASESSDPDGLALTYKWWENGTKQSSTAQQWETGELTPGGSYTFKLEVTDPGGLSDQTEKTVTIK